MLSSVKFNDHSYWVSVFEPLPHERDELFEKYEVTSDLLDYAIDPYEKARIEIDRDAGITLLIFDVYITNHEESAPQTAPVGIMLTKNNVLTFTNAHTNFVNGLIAEQLQRLQSHGDIDTRYDFILPILYRLSTAYFPPIRRADQQRQKIQNNLRRRTERSAINEFMELETGLVYILTSLQGNVSLLQEFKRRFGYRMSVDQQSDLDDVIIEAQQGLEMAQMTSDVTGRVSDAYSKVLDSNLNQTMKFLTVYSIILSIPPIVSGFYGENVKSLPFANNDFAWQITIIITLIMVAISIWLIFNKWWWR